MRTDIHYPAQPRLTGHGIFPPRAIRVRRKGGTGDKGAVVKKVVAPAVKREAVAHLKDLFGLSKRRACQIAGADRKMVAPILAEGRANARWSLDFVHDQFACGRRFRVLHVVADVRRECLDAISDTSISGECGTGVSTKRCSETSPMPAT